MSLPVNYKRVLRQIKVGAGNPTTGAEIALTLKLDERTVQKIINRLVTYYEVPIIGVRHGFNRGYFIPEDKAELLDGAKSFYNQLQDEQKRLNVLMNAEPEEYKQLVKELLKGA